MKKLISITILYFLGVHYVFSQDSKTEKSGPEKSDTSNVSLLKGTFKSATFPGGVPALSEYLMKSTSFFHAKGTIIVSFVIETTGKTSRLEVIQEIPNCPECNEEAIKAIKNMPAWIPATLNGTPVEEIQYIPITFGK